MTIGLVGQKRGMTRIFTEDGASIPVTVIEVLPNIITQIKTLDHDGYRAVQVTTGSRKRTRVDKAMAGHFAKAKVEPGRGAWEFRMTDNQNIDDMVVGAELKVDRFSVGQYIDVTGTSKGKGFAGTVKRHHFACQDATHGNSLSHRAPGSIGQRQSPGRVFKGKRMSGQMGNEQCTVLSQQVIRIDVERHLLLIQGTVPGAPGSDVIIRPAVKKAQAKKGE